ncbi:hypothetical protein D3C80_1619350 [compost metagenome]
MTFPADVLPWADVCELRTKLTKLLIDPAAASLQGGQYLFIASPIRRTDAHATVGVNLDQYA